MFRIVGYRAGYSLFAAQVHSPPFPSLLCAGVDCMGETLIPWLLDGFRQGWH